MALPEHEGDEEETLSELFVVENRVGVLRQSFHRLHQVRKDFLKQNQ